MQITRRAALALFPLSAAGVVAGCGIISTTTTNGVTTVTINVPTAEAYISGVAALAASLIALPGVPAATVAIVNTVLAQLNSAIPALNTASGGNVTLTFDTTSVPAFVTAMEANVAMILKNAAAVVASFGGSVPPQVTTYYNAIGSVANAIAALFRIATTAGAPTGGMTVQQALDLVHIQAPA